MTGVFWTSKEKFLVIDILPERTTAVSVEIDEGRTIHIKKCMDPFSWDPSRKFFSKVIVSVDAALIHDVMIPLKFTRSQGKAIIGKIEMENLLAQTVTRVFTEYRKQAAQALGVDELHAILVGARTLRFAIDGREVINPIGLPGKKIETILEITFTTRDLFERWKEFFAAPHSFLFTDGVRSNVAVLEKLHEAPIQFLALDPRGSSYYIVNRSLQKPVLHRGVLEWSLSALWSVVSARWGIPQEAAIEVCGAFLRGEVSWKMAQLLHSLHQPLLDELKRKLEKSKLKNRVCVVSATHLPFALPMRCGKVVLEEAPTDALAQKFGYSIDTGNTAISRGKLFHTLASLWEFYYDNNESPINRFLHRRVHWLVPDMSVYGSAGLAGLNGLKKWT